MTPHFVFETNPVAKKIRVERVFNAPLAKVWKAWTDPALLEKWIVFPHWTAVTKTLDFTVGGVWLYAMVSPQGEYHWVYAQFTAIEEGRAISSTGRFCDADGNPLLEGPKSYRDTTFYSLDEYRTKIEMVLAFEEEATLSLFVEGGFQEGIATTLTQLDEMLVAA